jgi:hypothetical protein
MYDLMLHDLVLDGWVLANINEMQNTAGVLDNYPMVDQLHEPTSDGLADENARMNCAFASYTSGVKFLCYPNHQDVNGDYIKDHCPPYGQNYLGGAAGENIAPTVEKLYGVHTDIDRNSDRGVLLSGVIQQIDQRHPSVVTMPSAWNSQVSKAGYNPNYPDFPTHAGAAFGYNPSTSELLVMNPWGGFIHRGTYQYWIDRFCYMKTYRLSLLGAQAMPLPTGWKDANGVLTNPMNPHVVKLGVRTFVLNSASWEADDVPLEEEHGVDVLEYSHLEYGQGALARVQQTFNKSMVAAIQDAKGNWSIGKEYLGAELMWYRAHVADLQAQITALKNAPVPPPPPVTSQAAFDKVHQDLKDAGKVS